MSFGKCKKCGFEKTSINCKNCKRLRRLTPEGKLIRIYETMVKSTKDRIKRGTLDASEGVSFSRNEFINRYLNDETYLYYHNLWEDNNYSRETSPSFDRLDNTKGYSFDNIQIVDWKTNRTNWHSNISKGIDKHPLQKAIVRLSRDMQLEWVYNSITEAERDGYCRNNISRMLTYSKGLHLGKVFMYLDDFNNQIDIKR